MKFQLLIPGLLPERRPPVPIDRAFPGVEFRLLLADPPQEYQNFSAAKNGSYRPYYSAPPIEDLETLPVETVAAKDAVLLMWATGPKLPEAIHLLGAWGFRYVTILFVWHKRYRRSGNEFFGPGWYARSSTELVLLGKRGRGLPRASKRVRQLFDAAVGDHSHKPDRLFSLVDELFGAEVGPRLELFARRPGKPGTCGATRWDHGPRLRTERLTEETTMMRRCGREPRARVLPGPRVHAVSRSAPIDRFPFGILMSAPVHFRGRTMKKPRSAETVAKKLGITSRTLRRWMSGGCPGRGPDGAWDLEAIRRWRDDGHVIPARGGRPASQEEPEEEHAAGEPTDRARLLAACADERQAKAELAALRLVIERGEYILKADQIERDLSKVHVVRRGLLALSRSLPALLQGLDMPAMAAVIDQRVRALLTAYSRIQDSDDLLPGEEPGGIPSA